MVAKIERLAKGLPDFLGESSGLDGRICHVLDDGELITAQPGDQGRFPDALAQTRGNGLQQSVARRMSKRVVDFLEAVEVEHQHRQMGLALRVTARACSSRSRSNTRFGRSVSASCWAI